MFVGLHKLLVKQEQPGSMHELRLAGPEDFHGCWFAESILIEVLQLIWELREA